MKKIISLVLALVMILAFAACAKAPAAQQGEEPKAAAKTVKVIDIPLTEEEYAFGVDKKNADLQSSLNDYIAKIKSDGTLEKIMNNYFGDGTPSGVALGTIDKSKNQLVIATNAEFAPFEYLEGDLCYGVDIEIMKGFADSIGKELVISNMDFDSVLMAVDTGKADIAASGLTKNEKREQYVTFSTSYYNANQLIIVKSDDTTFDECKDLAAVENVLNNLPQGTKIGAQNGTTGKLYIEGDADWEFDGIKNAESKGYANGALAVQDLLSGNIDFVIIDEAPAKTLVEKYNAVA